MPLDRVWERSETLALVPPGEAAVWRTDVRTVQGRRVLAAAYDSLTDEDRERAARMREGLPREEFVAGRGSLRRLLGFHLGCEPREIELAPGRWGKPELVADGSAIGDLSALRSDPAGLPAHELRGHLHFNVAHSRGMLLVVLSRAGAVGVDLERVDQTVETLEIARAAFHPSDCKKIEAAGGEAARALVFYRCWTRKEAVLKADGRGLLSTLEAFPVHGSSDVEEVVEMPPEPASERQAKGHPVNFYVRGIAVDSQFLAALALTRPHVRLCCYEM